jgi:LacI family transcriptional regulator
VARRGKVVTLYDVAQLAGVSTATVSRVVHDQHRVRAITKARVRQAIAELGYVPDAAAQSLSLRRTDMIGLVRPEGHAVHDDIENSNLLFHDEVLRGVEAHLRDVQPHTRGRDVSLLITLAGATHAAVSPRLQALSGKVDGILITQGFVQSPLLERLAARIPLVIIGGAPSQRSADVVTADNRSGSAALVTHLIRDHGRCRLFLVDGPPYLTDASERRLGLEHALRASPSGRLVGSHQGSFYVRDGAAAAERLLALYREDLPDAVVAANDQMAIGVLRVLVEAGVRVPQDVAVVGFDDVYLARLCDPPLTTVHHPGRLLGQRACARLFDRIADPSLPHVAELLPIELVLRSSCGCPPGAVLRQPVYAPETAVDGSPSHDEVARTTTTPTAPSRGAVD